MFHKFFNSEITTWVTLGETATINISIFPTKLLSFISFKDSNELSMMFLFNASLRLFLSSSKPCTINPLFFAAFAREEPIKPRPITNISLAGLLIK